MIPFVKVLFFSEMRQKLQVKNLMMQTLTCPRFMNLWVENCCPYLLMSLWLMSKSIFSSRINSKWCLTIIHFYITMSKMGSYMCISSMLFKVDDQPAVRFTNIAHSEVQLFNLIDNTGESMLSASWPGLDMKYIFLQKMKWAFRLLYFLQFSK